LIDYTREMVSPYIKFSQARRGAIQAANPGASFGELGKLLGAEWQTLSPEEKASYGSSATGTKTRKTRSNKGGHHRHRLQQTEELHNGLPVYTNKNLMKGDRAKNNKTRKARKGNPYAAFVKAHWAERKAKNPGASLGAISKEIAALWKAQK